MSKIPPDDMSLVDMIVEYGAARYSAGWWDGKGPTGAETAGRHANDAAQTMQAIISAVAALYRERERVTPTEKYRERERA